MSDFRPDIHLAPSEKDHTYLIERPLRSEEVLPQSFRFTFGGAYVQTTSEEREQHRAQRRGLGEGARDFLLLQAERDGER